MAEELIISTGISKEEKYQQLLPQLHALIEWDGDLIANLANIVAALKQSFDFFWVGVYFVKNGELVLGPFQGPIACTRIGFGKGVCGKSWEEKRAIVVEDVEKFPGHISCNAGSKSEIVLPAFNDKEEVFLVLDIDSNKLADFDTVDEKYLLQVMGMIGKLV